MDWRINVEVMPNSENRSTSTNAIELKLILCTKRRPRNTYKVGVGLIPRFLAWSVVQNLSDDKLSREE